MPAVLRGLPVAARVGLFVLCYLVLRHAAVLGSQLMFGRVPPVGVPVWMLWGTMAGGPPLVLAGLCSLFTLNRERRVPVLCWMLGAAALIAFCWMLFAVGLQFLSPSLSGRISLAQMVVVGIITGSFLALGMGAPDKAVVTGALFAVFGSLLTPIAVFLYRLALLHPVYSTLLPGALFALYVALALEYFQRHEGVAHQSRRLSEPAILT